MAKIPNVTMDKILAAILVWREEEDKNKFDPSFIESLQEGYENYGGLTENQENAVYNIIERYDINVSEYL